MGPSMLPWTGQLDVDGVVMGDLLRGRRPRLADRAVNDTAGPANQALRRVPGGRSPIRQPSISTKRSTSTSPLSVILRCGITGSGRKATCRNGSARVVPSALAARSEEHTSELQ